MYEEHKEGVKALEVYTVANTHLAYVCREDNYMAKVQNYSEHVRQEWWRCYDHSVQLEVELAKYGISLPSPYLKEYHRYAPPEDPLTAELWTTQWEKLYDNEWYVKWKNTGFLNPDVVLWFEGQTKGGFWKALISAHLIRLILRNTESTEPTTPPSSTTKSISEHPGDIPDTPIVCFYPQNLTKIVDMLKRCALEKHSASQTSETGGMLKSQCSTFTIPEELSSWFMEKLVKMKGETEEEENTVEISGSLAQAIQEVILESQESATYTQLSKE